MARTFEQIIEDRKKGNEKGTYTKKYTSFDDILERRRSGNSKLDYGVDNEYIQTFQKDLNNYYTKAQQTKNSFSGASSNKDYFDSTGNDLFKRAGIITAYANRNRSKMNSDEYANFMNSLKETKSNITGISDSFKEYYDTVSKFKTEDEYNDWVKQVETEKKQRTWDTVAGQKEIDALENQLNEYKQLEALKTTYENQYAYQDSDSKLLEQNAEYENVKSKISEYEKKYKSISDFKQYIADKRAFNNKAKYIQNGMKMAAVADPESASYDPEFNKYAAQGKALDNGKSLFYLFNKNMNGNEVEAVRRNAQEQYEKDPEKYDKDATVGKSKEQNQMLSMTADEVAIYNYYLGKYGQDKADEYFDSIKESLGTRSNAVTSEKTKDNLFAQYAVLSGANASEAFNAIGRLFNSGKEYIPYSYEQQAISSVSEDIADKYGEKSLASVGGDLIGTVSRMAPSIAVGAANPAAGAAMMGFSSAGDAYQEAINAGHTGLEARTYSILVGASEAALQYLLGGIENLGGKVTQNVSTKMLEKLLSKVSKATTRAALKSGGKFVSNMISEFTEEYLQEILTPVFENVALGKNNDFDLFTEDALYAGILGALSAGVLNGVSAGANTINTYKTGLEVVKAENADVRIGRLKELGTSAPADSVAYQLAGKIDEKTGAYKIGKLISEVGGVITEQNTADIKDSLITKGMAEADADTVSVWLEKIVNDPNAKLTKKQISALNDNPVINETFMDVIVNKDSTISQRNQKFGEVFQNAAAKYEMAFPLEQQQKVKEKVSESGVTRDTTTGQPVQIEEVATEKDGVRYLKTSDGGLISQDNMEYASTEEATAFEMTTNMNPVIANAVIHNAVDKDPVDYYNGMREGIQYIAMGLPERQIPRSGFFGSLSETDQRYAIELGKQQRNIMESQQAQKVANAKKYLDTKGNRTKRQGKVTFKKGVEAKTEHEKAAVQMAKGLAKLGIDFAFYRDTTVGKKGKRNGYYDANGVIHINLSAGLTGESMAAFTMSHELVHFIAEYSPKEFRILADIVTKHMKRNGLDINDSIKRRMEVQGTTEAIAFEDAVADACETMLVDGSFTQIMQEVQKQNPSLYKRIKTFVENLIRKIESVLKGLPAQTKESAALRESVDAMRKMTAAFTKGVMTAADNHGAIKAANHFDTKVVEVAPNIRYSLVGSFDQQVDNVLKNQYDKENHVYVGNTPSTLVKILGIKNLPMLITNNHVYSMAVSKQQAMKDGRYNKRSNYHNLGADLIKKIPEALSNPVLIVKSNSDSKNSDFVVVTDLFDKNNNRIIIALKPSGKGTYYGAQLESNIILSGYGKDNLRRYLTTAQSENRILYANKKYNQQNKNNPEVQFLDRILSADYDKSLTQYKHIVNSQYTQNTEKNSYVSPKEETPGKYTYEYFVSKPDMQVTVVDDTVPLKRADVVALAKKNAAKVGTTKRDGSVAVHVSDIDTDVILSTKGLIHGFDRRFKDNAPVTLKAGEILKNSIRINEMTPSKKEADSSYVLIGVARNSNENFYLVRSVVNKFSNNLLSMDVLYAINAKKSTAVLNAPLVSTPNYRTKISISNLLEYVNRFFPDILPESVLKHFGHTERPEGSIGKNALYQTVNKETDVTPRTILTETDPEKAENEAERIELKQYQMKSEEFNEVNRKLQEQNKILKESESKDELIKAKNRKAILEKKRTEIRDLMRKIENGETLKKLIKREADKKIARIDKIASASYNRRYLATPVGVLRQAVTELEKGQFDIASKNRLDILKKKFDKMDELNQKIDELKSKEDISLQDRNRIQILSSQWDRLNSSVYSMASKPFVNDLVNKSRELLIAKYDAIAPGEKPYRKVAVPLQTSDQAKVSKTMRTAMEAEVTTDEMVEELNKAVVKGEFSYLPITDDFANQKAVAQIEKNGWDESVREWYKKVGKGSFGKEDMALGYQLYNNAVNAGDTKLAMDILTDIAKYTRSCAQSLQAVRLLKKLTPENGLYCVRKSVQALQEKLDNKYGDKAPQLAMNSELVKNYLNASTEAEAEAAQKALYRDIAAQTPNTFMDKWNAWRYLCMLGNVKTHIRNILGNAGFVPVRFSKNVIGTGLESMFGIEDRTKSLGVGKDLMEIARKDYDAIADQITMVGKYNDAISEIEKEKKPFKNKVLSTIYEANSKALEAEDVLFAKAAYAGSLAGYLKANKITAEQWNDGKVTQEFMDKARAYAVKEAQKATYRDLNAFSDWVAAIGRSGKNKNFVDKTAGYLMEGALPFRRTPANILVRGVEYSPIGLINGLANAAVNIKKGKITAAEAIDKIASGATGTILMGLGALLFKLGFIHPSDDDNDKQAGFDDLIGIQGYSLDIGGVNVTLDWLAPESIPFFMGAEFARSTEKYGISFMNILNAFYSVSGPFFELSMLSGIKDAIENASYSSSENGIISVAASFALSYFSQGLPTIFGQLERITENEREMTFVDKNSELPGNFQRSFGTIFNKLPFVDYNQIPYIDAWGRTVDTGNVAEKTFNNMLNPAYVTDRTETEVDKELQRLYQAGFDAVYPKRAATNTQVEGKYLDKDQYIAFATTKGKTQHDVVQDIVGSSWYSRISDEDKANIIEDAYTYANEMAKLSVDKNASIKKWVQKAKDAETVGIKVSDYILYYENVKPIESIKDDEGNSIANSKGLQTMEYLYSLNLTDKQREYLMDCFDVGQKVYNYSSGQVNQALTEMR